MAKEKHRNIPADKSVLILVQGDDDLFTLSNYIGKHWDAAVREQYRAIHFFPFAEAVRGDLKERDALRYALKQVSKTPGFQQIRALGVLCDADHVRTDSTTSARAATAAHIQSAFRDAGIVAPTESGTWSAYRSDEHPNLERIGFLVIPPDRESGCLETMLWDSVAPKLAELKCCAESLLSCAEPIYAKNFPQRVADPNHSNWQDKVRVHALLAASEEPQTYVTDATLRGFWDFNSPGLARVLEFLKGGQANATPP